MDNQDLKPVEASHSPIVPLMDEETVQFEDGGYSVTHIPARLDRLPFGRYHAFIVFTLGVTWMLDGLETTLLGVVAGVLKGEDTLGFSDFQIGLSGTIYLTGAISGSLFFGYLCDRFGRKRLYMITPLVYLTATGLTAFSWNFPSFAVLRFFTGAGLGGEYAAMNSAIDELIPAPVRGCVDLVVNGSYWLGTIITSSSSLFLLNMFHDADVGWRVMCGAGAAIGSFILVLRFFLPESPRWLLTHGRETEAEEIVSSIEERVCKYKGISVSSLPPVDRSILIKHRKNWIGFTEIAKTMCQVYPKRSFLGLSLMITQAFFYNAVFFSYALILLDFYDVESRRVGLYLLPFAVVNFLGPVLLGRLFDTFGRKAMITFTYIISGILLLVFGVLFVSGLLNAYTHTLCTSIVAFFASAAASSAYLTVSEIFPLEIRGLAISFFYSVGTGAGGLAGPVLFGALLESKTAMRVFVGYIIGASLMIAGGLIELMFGVKAERKSLEDIAPPLSSSSSLQERHEEYIQMRDIESSN